MNPTLVVIIADVSPAKNAIPIDPLLIVAVLLTCVPFQRIAGTPCVSLTPEFNTTNWHWPLPLSILIREDHCPSPPPIVKACVTLSDDVPSAKYLSLYST